MTQYPLTFEVRAESASGMDVLWSAQSSTYDRPVQVAIPPEFHGPGGGLSPEDLYAMALQNCFIATFKVFAQKSRLEYQKIQVAAKLEVDRNEKGHPWMARIQLDVDLYGAQQSENAQRILERASQSCMILNSVKTDKTFTFRLH